MRSASLVSRSNRAGFRKRNTRRVDDTSAAFLFQFNPDVKRPEIGLFPYLGRLGDLRRAADFLNDGVLGSNPMRQRGRDGKEDEDRQPGGEHRIEIAEARQI